MKLIDLNPDLEGTVENGYLTFLCPCREHFSRIPIGGAPKGWHSSGTYPDTLTLSPSILNKSGPERKECWHGYIRNGEMVNA